MNTPTAIMDKLCEIEEDLAVRQQALESAARDWIKAKREREKEYSIEFIKAEGTVDARKARAIELTAMIGVEHEAEFEALKAVVKTLEARGTITMALLKAHNTYDNLHAQTWS